MKPTEREKLWPNLLLNVLIPIVVLTWLDPLLGPLPTFLLALMFPLVYGVHDYLAAGRKNIFSIVSILGIVSTGSVGLLRLGPEWVIWREPILPSALGVFCLVSLRTDIPAWRLIYHESVYATERIEAALRAHGNEGRFHDTLRHVTFLLAGSFFFSALLNYLLARAIIKSQPGTEAFNAEFARMLALTLPVIVVPFLLVIFGIVLYLAYRLCRLTGLPLNKLYRATSKFRK